MNRFAALGFAVLVLASQNASAQIVFQDMFSGPTLNPVWQAGLPTPAQVSGGGIFPINYIGTPNYSFQPVGGASAIRLTNTMSDQQRRGWSTSTAFTVPNFSLEMRFYTHTQSAAASIDAFVELWLIDAANSSRYELIAPYGGSFSTVRSVAIGSSIDNVFSGIPYPYANDGWYRVRYDSSGNQLTATFTDDGGNPVLTRVFNHDISAFPNGFRIGIGQAIGNPSGTFPVDVSIDYVTLTALFHR